jgi:hypothetical protein
VLAFPPPHCSFQQFPVDINDLVVDGLFLGLEFGESFPLRRSQDLGLPFRTTATGISVNLLPVCRFPFHENGPWDR